MHTFGPAIDDALVSGRGMLHVVGTTKRVVSLEGVVVCVMHI